jgi:hypothetical protein
MFTSISETLEKKTRIQPIAYLMNPKDKHELEVNNIFGPGGATRELTYIIYYFYMDNNLLLNLPKQTSNVYFSSLYLRHLKHAALQQLLKCKKL